MLHRNMLLCSMMLAACSRGTVVQATAKPAPAFAPDGGNHHTARLARAAWKGDVVRVCGSTPVCSAASPAGPVPDPGDAGFAADTSRVDFAPGGCRVLDDDVVAAAKGPPARARLYGPSGATDIASWAPPLAVDGDLFALETSFSPDGKWVAVMKLAVGIGEGPTLVEVAGVDVKPSPPCR